MSVGFQIEWVVVLMMSTGLIAGFAVCIWRAGCDLWRVFSMRRRAVLPDLRVRIVCDWCGRHLKGDREAPTVEHGTCMACKSNTHRLIQYLRFSNQLTSGAGPIPAVLGQINKKGKKEV